MSFFITGATGNVGSAVVYRLLRTTEAAIWILVRASSDGELLERVDRLYRLWGIEPSQVLTISARLHAVRGDMRRPHFGMNERDWDAVVTQCDHVIHAAGVVRMNLPLEEARSHAVGSTDNVIALAEAIAARGSAVDVAFVSTVGVAGKQREPLVEEWVQAPREFHNTYERSKAEAEERLRSWDRGPGIRLTVHRPSMVVGASDGNFLHHQVFYYICEFLSGRYTLGLQPRLDQARLDTVPVDYVAKAVIYAVQQPESDGRIFNLCSGPGDEVTISAVQNWTREILTNRGQKLPSIRGLPIAAFRLAVQVTMAVASGQVKRRLATLPVLIDYLESPQVFDGSGTRRYFHDQASVELQAPDLYLPEIIESFYE